MMGPVNRKSEIVSPVKHTTVIGKLLDSSKKKIDSEFDHMKIRQSVVAQKSMFKGDKKVSELIEHEETFLLQLKGEFHN